MKKSNANYIKEKYKTKEEWLNNRGIGGSSASAIINKSKWMSAIDVYNDLALGIKKQIQDNDRMREGRIAEDLIRKLFILEHPEYKVTPQPKHTYWLFRRKDYPLITCTPDGLFVDTKNSKKYGLEIKDVELRRKDYKEDWESGKIPIQYYCQCLHYMLTMEDLDGVLLLARLKYYTHDSYLDDFVLDHCEDRCYWIYRDEHTNDIKYLEQAEINFIDNNINKKVRPSLKITI